jgi:hypothetical protein
MLYADCGRTARPDEIATIRAMLNGGKTAADVRQTLATTPEATLHVNDFYKTVLGRTQPPSAGEVKVWEDQLASGVSLDANGILRDTSGQAVGVRLGFGPGNTLVTAAGQTVGSTVFSGPKLTSFSLDLEALAAQPGEIGGIFSTPIPPPLPQTVSTPTPPPLPQSTGGPPPVPTSTQDPGLAPADPISGVEVLETPDFDPATVQERCALRDAMGLKPNSGVDAHHIVPGGGPQSGGRDATAAQDKLAALGIGLNEAVNGVALSPGFHSKIHTKTYYDYINTELRNVTTKQDAKDRLAQIGQELQQADQTYEATGVLPSWIQ